MLKTVRSTSPATAKACALRLGMSLDVPGTDDQDKATTVTGIVTTITYKGVGQYEVFVEDGK